MNKVKSLVRRSFISGLAVVMALFAVGCGDKGESTETGQKYDPETRPLAMSISTPDGVFNPFFSTSAYDSSIVGMTQISMLTSDKDGNIVCGEDQPVVVLDYNENYNSANDTTTYKFILKNGIKFSDGEDLTMKDVLFNLYTYLDPAYTGSSTIYSTKIVGLEAYRQQDPNATETSLASFEQTFVDEANERIQNLIDFVYDFSKSTPSDDRPGYTWSDTDKVNYRKDFETVAKTFKEELVSDWNSAAESKESYKDWNFTETWQIFLYRDAQMTELLQRDASGKFVKDSDGNYALDTDASKNYEKQINDYLSENGYTAANKEEGIKNWCVELVYDSYIGATVEDTKASQFEQVAKYWQTATTVLDQFTAEAKTEYYSSKDKVVPKVSGIDGTGTTTKDFSGKDLGSSHEVLSITISGVDPKAIWNFAFTVAPMHYYSTNNYNGKDYIASFDESKGEFGLAFGDINFMNDVINASNKVGLPVGAGVYMASDENGNDNFTDGGKFYDKNMVYFKRNEYFYTLGSGISNAKIKYLRYKVVDTDQLIGALAQGNVDYGEPSATQENIADLNNSGVAHVEIQTSGYGYVGINPRFVPNITVRRAIMKAMNTQSILDNYYKGGLAELIWRPMSKTSWAYPQTATTAYVSQSGVDYSYDATGNDIEQMIKDAGYTKNSDGIYQKEISNYGTDTLSYTFTIAGSSTDHPAYTMFLNAQKILNRIGFQIKVVTSQTALSDLSTGKLTVWAAAWSSTIDPDMYQVYHKDSKATSTNNWGYPQIKANQKTYATEYALIQQLSELIDDGRATTNQDERKKIYSDALDLVMELAVEMPTYQRKDMYAYNADVLDVSTMTPEADRTPYNGLLARLWELNYN